MRLRCVLFAGLGLLLASGAGPPARARPVRSWSRADLWQKADLVLLAKAGDSHDESTPEKAKPETWVPVLTRFRVLTVMKRSAGGNRSEAATVLVRHYRYFSPDSEITVVDGPGFVAFDPRKENEYLIFLSAREGGVYEPLTGQYDPWQSFLRIEPYTHAEERPRSPGAGG